MRITIKKIGGLTFINLNNRYQISYCRLRAKSTRYITTRDDEWFHHLDIEPRHVMHSIPALDTRNALDTLDSNISARALLRVTRFMQSKTMREAKQIESVLMGFVVIPVVMIWSVLLVELADRFNLF